MFVTLLKSKIHRAAITGSSLDYAGSISIPPSLIRLAGLCEYEKVLVANVANGNRFETYVITGTEGEITLNGAAARLGQAGDKVIIMAWVGMDASEAAGFRPRLVMVDEGNRAVD
ncbi:MAG: aspartate 1-decarboxylase [Planctomycetota bacterium]|nr:aspartate 1-decarboxylase [Planctomycetota bacterium]